MPLAPSPRGAPDRAARVVSVARRTLVALGLLASVGAALPGDDAEDGSAEAVEGVPAPTPTTPGDAPPPLSPSVRVAPERWTVPGEVIAAVRAARGAPLGVRMDAASRTFLNLPYTNEAAGEGIGEDTDPPARYDTFDCLTFVEEVVSLALAGDPLYAPEIRNALRYKGTPSYTSRRHFMEAEWVPGAIQSGLLEDITARVGRASTLVKDVTPEVWKHWRRRSFFSLPDAALPVGPWTLSYLDLDAAEEALPRIPEGALLLTLRVPRDWSPVITTHISMVVTTEDGPRMRHATRMGAQKVRDDRVDWYIHHLRDYTNWPSLGITVLYPREQGPRLSALPRPPAP